ncbi:50S ribosomal protein L24 [Candidatus Peregrinibacteria bacterium]|nr:50S ribosomal protein L24 [Candidatus Peregrinibacteria bacterium]
MKIRRGDTVVVITGKDKGKKGQVLKVLHEKNRVVVGDVNMRTRHRRKTANQAGEIIKYEASIHASNVALLDPKSGKPTRIGSKVDEKTGRKFRIAKKSGEEIVKGKIAEKEVRKAPPKAQTAAPEAAVQSKGKSQPFWKKMGFGAEALKEQAEVDGSSHMQEDHSVPDQAQRESSRSHSRGS